MELYIESVHIQLHGCLATCRHDGRRTYYSTLYEYSWRCKVKMVINEKDVNCHDDEGMGVYACIDSSFATQVCTQPLNSILTSAQLLL